MAPTIEMKGIYVTEPTDRDMKDILTEVANELSESSKPSKNYLLLNKDFESTITYTVRKEDTDSGRYAVEIKLKGDPEGEEDIEDLFYKAVDTLRIYIDIEEHE